MMSSTRTKHRRGFRLLITAAAGFAWFVLNGQPAFAAPAYTNSYYETNTNASTLNSQGCTVAQQGVTGGEAVLDFGAPALVNGAYGMLLHDLNNTFASNSAIEASIQSFSDGYHRCWPGYGSIEIAMGTNNGYIPAGWSSSTAYTAGQKLHGWVDTLQSYMNAHAYNLQVAAGADDIELRWSGASITRSMIDGFNSLSSPVSLLDYGDDAGGPCTSGCGGNWTTDNVYYVAYQASDDFPVPEIYYTADATQDWVPTAIAEQSKGFMYFLCTMTEWPTSGTLTPAGGWNALYNALATYGDQTNLNNCSTNI
jgi:hypothetical protein